jgi:hypothetical protein
MTGVTSINLSNHDDIYQNLLDLHDGKSEAESSKINAKLILTLMNIVGDPEVVQEAIELVAASTEKWSCAGMDADEI